eukprot:2823471-Amphidinium_carterae.5
MCFTAASRVKPGHTSYGSALSKVCLGLHCRGKGLSQWPPEPEFVAVEKDLPISNCARISDDSPESGLSSAR